MEQPPFPYVLVIMVGLFGFIALTSGPLWIRIIAAIGTVTLAAAAVYQSRPRRAPEDPIDDENV